MNKLKESLINLLLSEDISNIKLGLSILPNFFEFYFESEKIIENKGFHKDLRLFEKQIENLFAEKEKVPVNIIYEDGKIVYSLSSKHSFSSELGFNIYSISIVLMDKLYKTLVKNLFRKIEWDEIMFMRQTKQLTKKEYEKEFNAFISRELPRTTPTLEELQEIISLCMELEIKPSANEIEELFSLEMDCIGKILDLSDE